MRSDETRRARVWGLILRVTPYLRGQNPLWHLAFSYWDDATGCGCWRESGRRRWLRAARRVA